MRNDGGPAFPIANAVFDADAPDAFEQFKAATSQSQGMSMRDYFAAAALTGMIANTSGRTIAARVKHAWEYADAMLAEREK